MRKTNGWTGGRIAAVVGGSILALVALGLLVAGAFALGAANSNGGWVSLGHSDYQTDTYAVVTEPVNWSDSSYVAGAVDKVRVRVTPNDASTPVFLGMAPRDAVDRYLSGVRYVTAHDGDNFSASYTLHDGQAPSQPPADALPWTMKASGVGTQTLEFTADDLSGDQVAVVMNAAATPSVAGSAEAKVTAPWLNWLGAGLLIAGAVIAAGAVLLIVLPIRRASARQQQQPPVEPPADMARAA